MSSNAMTTMTVRRQIVALVYKNNHVKQTDCFILYHESHLDPDRLTPCFFRECLKKKNKLKTAI